MRIFFRQRRLNLEFNFWGGLRRQTLYSDIEKHYAEKLDLNFNFITAAIQLESAQILYFPLCNVGNCGHSSLIRTCRDVSGSRSVGQSSELTDDESQ